MTDGVRPDVGRVLDGLRDFQRETVEYVFNRLYGDDDPTDRFLIADEVGLGKTFVARGVTARAVDCLWDDVERIDVVYICSNADIARQNISRLKLPGTEQVALASRITLLPTQVHDLKRNRLNFVSFTPGTSLDPKSSLGRLDERALLYLLLQRAWGLSGRRAGPKNVLQGAAGRGSFEDSVAWLGRERGRHIDVSLADQFARELERHDRDEQTRGVPGLRDRFDDLCERMSRRRDYRRIPEAERADRAALVSELRAELAATCVTALEPDLVILDEFQRFKYVLQGDDPAAQLARDLFTWKDEQSNARARVLLLSATPYKMYTLAHEVTEDDHHRDFLSTLDFLHAHDHERTDDLRVLLVEYKRELLTQSGPSLARLRELRDEIERRLARVVSRTERLGATTDRNGMLEQKEAAALELTASDVDTYLALQRMARALKHPDVTEYWKSSPYVLNFMDTYQLKKRFAGALNDPVAAKELAQITGAADQELMLAWDRVTRYEEIAPANARMRAFLQDVVGRGAWRALWVPPSLPYYELGGPYADSALKGLSKRLVFSSWQLVPKAIATLVTYAAEAEIMRAFEEGPVNTPEARERRARLLDFRLDDGRPASMPVLGMLYPSPTLARACDPLELAREFSGHGRRASTAEALAWAEGRVGELLEAELPVAEGESRTPDEAWYWAAPLLIDVASAPGPTRSWWDEPNLSTIWSDGEEGDSEDSRWSDHVEHARRLLRGELELGRKPEDLARVVALQALAGPGVAALRALSRVTGDADGLEDSDVRDAAARVAWGLRSLFNLPEVTALLRVDDRRTPYWRKVLGYSLEGGLQSLLDEYAHVLVESLGMAGKGRADVVNVMAEEMQDALTLRGTRLGMDEVAIDGDQGIELHRHTMRAQFAVRFGEERGDDGSVTRVGQVRKAFNSPFWPFVLASTSVGQEGLDFHVYCHSVVHWNLPSNPVDLEQREGRVHRYKGHAVRKNLALQHGDVVLADGGTTDPWTAMFEKGEQDRKPGDNDLVPYWIYAVEGGAKIERHVPALPLSRDLVRYEALRRSLVVYRMAFGQSRQEDLVSYLLTRFSDEDAERLIDELRIDLSPPAVAAKQTS